MSEWIEHDGKTIPFKIGDEVCARRRDGSIYAGTITETQMNMYMGFGLVNPMMWAINGRCEETNSYNDVVEYIILPAPKKRERV